MQSIMVPEERVADALELLASFQSDGRTTGDWEDDDA
jgi:hypothetical protein